MSDLWSDYPVSAERPPMTAQRRRALLIVDEAFARAQAVAARIRAERSVAAISTTPTSGEDEAGITSRTVSARIAPTKGSVTYPVAQALGRGTTP